MIIFHIPLYNNYRLYFIFLNLVREATKKFFSGPVTKRGGGGKVLATKKKELFWAREKKMENFCGH